MKFDFHIDCINDERAYHNTAILIYLKAIRDVMGNVDVAIGNSLNQGYFSYIEKGRALSATDVHRIWNRMDSIAREDIEIKTEKYTIGELIKKWHSAGWREKVRLLELMDPEETVEICTLDGYSNCFYSKVLPYTGCINLFELRPYRNGLLLRLPNALNPDSLPAYRDDDKLYDAYADSMRLRRTTKIHYLGDVNKIINDGNEDELINSSERLQQKYIDDFAARIVREKKRIVLIAGPSSSGKTTFAKRLCEGISAIAEEPIYLGTDDYFVEREDTPLGPDGKPDFEGLESLDLDLFNKQMEDLLAGKEVDVPEFDFISGKKIFGKRFTRVRDNQIIVIEGIHSLNDVLTANIPRDQKFKIYISPLTQIALDRHNRISTADARLLRRIVRDNQFRGNSAEATIDNWPKVRAGESKNIFPYSSSADVVFNSSTVYETNLLRTYVEPLLKAIPAGSEHYEEAQRILYFLRFFRPILSAESVRDSAIIREFIGRD